MKKERGEEEPTIIDILNEELRKGSNSPDNFPTVQKIAETIEIDNFTLNNWLEKDKLFQEGLATVKHTHDNDPNRDTPDDDIKLDAASLSFGIVIVLKETKKRYTV
jgi:hypothetical protein